MLSKSVLAKMRAALLVCTCVAGCARGKHAGDTADANANPDANGPTKIGQSAASDLDASLDASALSDADIIDDDDEPHDAAIDAPYGVIACPIHGAHPKLPDGGVDMTGLLTAKDPKSKTDPSVIGIGGVGGFPHECGGCGMGGPRPGNFVDVGTNARASLGSVLGTTRANDAIAHRTFTAGLPQARACYRKGLNIDPTQQGSVIVTVKFDPSGAPSSVDSAVSGSISAPLAQCVVSRIRRLAATPELASATLRVTYSFAIQ